MEQDFLSRQKQEFLSALRKKGYDEKKCKEFLETKGMYSLSSHEILTSNLKKMDQFINPLKVEQEEKVIGDLSFSDLKEIERSQAEHARSQSITMAVGQPVMMIPQQQQQ